MQRIIGLYCLLILAICVSCVKDDIPNDDLEVITPGNYQNLEQIQTLGATWATEDDLSGQQHLNIVSGVRFNADGSRIMSLDQNGIVIVWDVATGESIYFIDSLNGASDFFEGIAYQSSNEVFAVASRGTSLQDGIAAVFDLQTGEEINRISFAPTISQRIQFSGSDTLLLMSNNTPDTGTNESVLEWNYVNNSTETMVTIPHSIEEASFTAIDYYQNKSLLVTTTNYRPAEVRTYQNNIALNLTEQLTPTFAVAFNSTGTLIASGGSHEAHIWNTDDLSEFASTTGDFSDIISMTFSPTDDLIAFSTQSNIAIWNYLAEDEVTLFEHDDGVGSASVQFSPDGKLLAAGHWDGTVRIWGVRSQD